MFCITNRSDRREATNLFDYLFSGGLTFFSYYVMNTCRSSFVFALLPAIMKTM